MRDVKAEYVGDVEINGERLHVWKNPETNLMFAVDNLEIDATKNHVNDPYQDGVRLHFHDTFTGLPK